MKNVVLTLCQELKEEADGKDTRDSDEGVRFRVFLSSQNFTSGMWLSVYKANNIYKLAPAEFLTSCCRRNTVVNPLILRANRVGGEIFQQTRECTCAGGNRQQPRIDPFGIHILKCPINGTPTKVHNALVQVIVILLRSIGLAVSLEPIGLFDNVNTDDNRRPDILVHNPFGGGSRVILDVAVTGVTGRSRSSDEDVDQPLRIRYHQKKAKYGHIARANGLTFIPAIFSHTGQIQDNIMGWMFNQIKMKMELEDPQVQSGKIQSVMRYWTRQLSAVINRTASRSILAAATNLVDRVNSESPTAVLSDQGDDTLRANHETVQRFMEDMELSVLNQDLTQI